MEPQSPPTEPSQSPEPAPQPPFQPPQVIQPTVISPSLPSPAAPGYGEGGYVSAPVAMQLTRPPRSRKPLLFLVVLVGLLVLLGGGYLFAFYLPNTPPNLYKTSLSRTADAYDQLVKLTSLTQAKKYTSTAIDGSFSFTAASSASGDGSLSFKSDHNNAIGSVNFDVMGEKFTANIRSIKPSKQTNPDVYFQVSGIKSLLDNIGLTQEASLDGQWIAVDHTLLDSVSANLRSSQKAPTAAITPTEIQDAMNKVGAVNRQYLFTTDSKQAVLVRQKDLGTSQLDGRQVYGYQLGYNKTNLQAYVGALGKALDSSSLNTWAKQENGKSISSTLNVAKLQSSLSSAQPYSFTMYVDTHTKLVHSLRFTDPKSTDYFTIGQNYTGGTSYPFSFSYVSNHDPSNSATLKLTATADSSTSRVTVGLNANGKQSDQPFSVTANATITPGNDTVQVTAPANSKPVMELLQSLGLQDLLSSPATSAGASSSASNLFTLTQ